MQGGSAKKIKYVGGRRKKIKYVGGGRWKNKNMWGESAKFSKIQRGGLEKIGDWPSQVDGPPPTKNDSSLMLCAAYFSGVPWKAEMGAMRFVKNQHTLLYKYAEELGLGIRNFTTAGPNDRIYFLRDQLFR